MQCKHGDMVYREGFSQKTQKPWKGHFCPTPKGTPDQCPPQFIKEQGGRQAAPQAFNNQLNSAQFKDDQKKKDETITRTAVVKSIIERGDKYSVETTIEAAKWVAWILQKPHAPAPPPDMEVPTQVSGTGATMEREINIEDIPGF